MGGLGDDGATWRIKGTTASRSYLEDIDLQVISHLRCVYYNISYPEHFIFSPFEIRDLHFDQLTFSFLAKPTL